MTDPPLPPLGADAPREDYVGIAIGALAFGVSAGVGLNAVVGFVVRTIQARNPPANALDLGRPEAVALLWGTVAACFAGAGAAWLLMRPMKNPYRQGMFAIVALFATFMFSTLTMAADRAFGRPGLAGLALLALGLCLAIKRRLASTEAA